MITSQVYAQREDVSSLGQEQAQEKLELKDMQNELNDIKSEMSQAAYAAQQAQRQITRKQIKEFHLVAKEIKWELLPGVVVSALSFNGQVPGPTIRVQEGDIVRIVLHNELKVPTSLYFHGLILAHNVDGLPRQKAGLVGPGETYTYEFTANHPGTVWYHPQVIHTSQIASGLSGVLVVEPTVHAKSYTKDNVFVIGQWEVVGRQLASSISQIKARSKYSLANQLVVNASVHKSPLTVTYFTFNGKPAPFISPIIVRKGERIRLRLVNATQQSCPLYLTGHKLEIMAINGSTTVNGKYNQDLINIEPGGRYDLEFTADNPGVWSLSSILTEQCTNDGQFPGGIACVVRYADFAK